MIIPSSVASMRAPSFVNSATTVSIRFVSFTFNSCASLITVIPSACVAANAITGISSINLGIISPPISIPFNEDVSIVIFAAGSDAPSLMGLQ